MKISLNGKWEFRERDGEFAEGTVPGCNYSDLLALGKIPDPFKGTNEKDVQSVSEKDWEYRRSFDVPAGMLSADRTFLCFEQLDTVCEINLNGKVFHADNAFIGWRFDVTGALKETDNVVTVMFPSPVKLATAARMLVRTPENGNGLTGISHLRKPACHFGWDWGPVLPVSGITGDVSVESCDVARIADFHIKQNHCADGKVLLSLSAEVEKFGDDPVSAEFSVLCPDGTELDAAGVDFGDEFRAEIVVNKPELWWTRELSDREKQPLYEAAAGISSGDRFLDGRIVKIGLRTIRLNREKDAWGQNFLFELNGVPVFAKGANCIPADALPARNEKAQTDRLIDAVLFSNMNMIRIWGGGYYASEYLLSRCDEEGILVWQDFMFACMGYPLFISLFRDTVLTEAERVVRRMRNHPSLALWCGNNEVEQMSPLWMHMTKYLTGMNEYFYGSLPALLSKLDDRDYIPGSPCGTECMMGTWKDNVGDTHLWQVWHGLQPPEYYRKRFSRFCSEYGFESLPDEKTVRFFMDGEEPSFKAPAMASHQKCRGGNGKVVYYGAARFFVPEKFTDYCYISQFCQAEACRTAAEHWRRNRGRCNGVLFWQLNDCWPVCSWSAVDWFGRYKALLYSARRYYSPVAVSIEDTDGGFTVCAVNDTNKALNAKLVFEVCDYDGKVIVSKESEKELPPCGTEKMLGLGMAAVRAANRHLRAYAAARLYVDGTEVSRSTVLLRREKYARLPKADIGIKTELDGRTLSVSLSSDLYARGVRITNDLCDAPFSDNWFDLLPGETVTVRQTLDRDCTEEEIEKAVSVFSAADLSRKGGLARCALARLGVLLRPINFLSRVFTRGVPLDMNRHFIEDAPSLEDYRE